MGQVSSFFFSGLNSYQHSTDFYYHREIPELEADYSTNCSGVSDKYLTGITSILKNSSGVSNILNNSSIHPKSTFKIVASIIKLDNTKLLKLICIQTKPTSNKVYFKDQALNKSKSLPGLEQPSMDQIQPAHETSAAAALDHENHNSTCEFYVPLDKLGQTGQQSAMIIISGQPYNLTLKSLKTVTAEETKQNSEKLMEPVVPISAMSENPNVSTNLAQPVPRQNLNNTSNLMSPNTVTSERSTSPSSQNPGISTIKNLVNSITKMSNKMKKIEEKGLLFNSTTPIPAPRSCVNNTSIPLNARNTLVARSDHTPISTGAHGPIVHQPSSNFSVHGSIQNQNLSPHAVFNPQMQELSNFMTHSRTEMDQIKANLQCLQKLVDQNKFLNVTTSETQWDRNEQNMAKFHYEKVQKQIDLDRALDSYDS